MINMVYQATCTRWKITHNIYLQLALVTLYVLVAEIYWKKYPKALSDDMIFACDCSRLHQTRFESCLVRGTNVSCETNIRHSGGIRANPGKNCVM